MMVIGLFNVICSDMEREIYYKTTVAFAVVNYSRKCVNQRGKKGGDRLSAWAGTTKVLKTKLNQPDKVDVK